LSRIPDQTGCRYHSSPTQNVILNRSWDVNPGKEPQDITVNGILSPGKGMVGFVVQLAVTQDSICTVDVVIATQFKPQDVVGDQDLIVDIRSEGILILSVECPSLRLNLS